MFLYTDGATEARPPVSTPPTARPTLGEDVLARVLADCRDLDAAAVVAHVVTVITDHNHNRPDDDTALLVIRVPDTMAEPAARELTSQRAP